MSDLLLFAGGSLERLSRACFAAGTLVHTKEGLKPIEEICVGDWVLSYPDDQVPPLRLREEAEYAYRQVVQTFVYDDKPVCEVSVINFGRNSEEFFKVTPDHPFCIKNEGWLPAGTLNCRKAVYNQNFTNSMIGEVIDNGERSRVYSFEVDEFHTYYVGEAGVWVHNACGAVKSLS